MIDLHTHSVTSDGSLTPRELACLAREAGITYLALTDHNTAQGLPEFLRAARGNGIYPVPGAEITCELAGEELHMLALDLPERHFSQIDDLMHRVLQWGEESRRELVDNLRRAGYWIDYDAICAAHPASRINRAHIGLALQEAGYVTSVREAFARLLNEEAGFYHPAPRLQAGDVIPAIRDLGAIPVWAHPFLRMDGGRVQDVLEQLVPRGLEGMEVFYTTYTPAQRRTAQELASHYRLKEAGGSDFHGASKPEIPLGGNLNIPEEIAMKLLER